MDKPFPYSEIVMDHFANPRNMGDMDDPSAVGNVGNPACGDMMRLYLKIKDGVIVDAKFKTFGCGAAIASSSMLTEMLKGKTLEEAMNISTLLRNGRGGFKRGHEQFRRQKKVILVSGIR
jgi:nitrogen fixation NifU-like protein